MIIPSNLPEQVEQVLDFDISYRVLHPAALLTNIQTNTTVKIPFSSLINKYKDFLTEIIETIELTDEEQEKYLYKPKKLSDDLYGTTELWSEIMVLNSAVSVIDFKPKKVKVYNPYRLKDYINEIMILEDVQ